MEQGQSGKSAVNGKVEAGGEGREGRSQEGRGGRGGVRKAGEELAWDSASA